VVPQSYSTIHTAKTLEVIKLKKNMDATIGNRLKEIIFFMINNFRMKLQPTLYNNTHNGLQT
jgi:hypothetical protein